MKNKFIWSFAIVGLLIALFLMIIFVSPKFVYFQSVKDGMVRHISEASGRSFEARGDFSFSLFPYAAIKTKDIQLGNPTGFDEKYMVRVDSFEARIKFIPLLLSLFKDFQVEKFILDGAEIVLVTNKDGSTNWAGSDWDIKKTKDKKGKPSATPEEWMFSLSNLLVGEFAVTNSSLLWIDHSKVERFQLSEVQMKVNDITLDRPISLSISCQAEDRLLYLDGNVGPLGKDLGQKKLPLDLRIDVVREVEIKLNGLIENAFKSPGFDVLVNIPQFSPRKLSDAAGWDFPVATADPTALDRMDFTAKVNGHDGSYSVSEGRLGLDASKIDFSCTVKGFTEPHLDFDLAVDRIDLNQYLPPKKESTSKEKKGENRVPGDVGKAVNYEPLRNLSVNGGLSIGTLSVDNKVIKDMSLRVLGKDGVFQFDPIHLKTYEGKIQAKGTVDVTKKAPETRLNVKLTTIDSASLIKDLLEKDLLEGPFNSEFSFQFMGDNAADIKKSLKGKGDVSIENGSIKGIDLVAMVRNLDGAYGFSRPLDKKRKTPFSILEVPFEMKKGMFITRKAKLSSPVFRVHAKGKADLIKESLNFRIEPVLVTTKNQDPKKMKKSEIMIPVLVTGTFSKPKYLPDLKGAAKEKLRQKIFESEKLKKVFEKEELKTIEKDVKDLLEGLF